MKSAWQLFTLLVCLRYGLSFLMFGGIYAAVHDNLDSVLVYNVVAGRFWASGFDTSVFDVFAGGYTPWYFYTQSLSPQTLFYALFPAELAYVANDFLGLVLGFFGMRILLVSLNQSGRTTNLFAALFAFSASFSTLGLGYLGAPILFWIATRPQGPSWPHWVAIILIGASSSLAIHGFFLPFALLMFLWLTNNWSTTLRAFLMALAFLGSSLLASAGVTYAAMFGPEMHRVEMLNDITLPTLSDVLNEIAAQFLILSGQAHSIVLPGLFALPFVLGVLFSKSQDIRRVGLKLSILIVVVVILKIFENHIEHAAPGPLSFIHVARLGLYLPLLVILAAADGLATSPSAGTKRFIGIGGALYGVMALLAMSGINPSSLKSAVPEHLHDGIVDDLNVKGPTALISPAFYSVHGLDLASIQRGGETFANHFQPEAYHCVKAAIGSGRVLSVGLDPMIAPYHGIAAIDGYHNLYPLEYKRAFRRVIGDQLEFSRKGSRYFDAWGSRLNSFVTASDAFHLDLDAARTLGATALISSFRIEHLHGSPTICGTASPIYLYSLNGTLK